MKFFTRYFLPVLTALLLVYLIELPTKRLEREIEVLEGRVTTLETGLDDLADLRDPNTHIYGRFWTLEERIEALEKARGLAPVITGYCVGRSVNDPSEVAFMHPVLVIDHAPFPYDHWFEIVVIEGDQEKSYLLASAGPSSMKDDLDGWIGTIRGDQTPHVFTPEAEYSLRVWRHPYEPMPEFTRDELVFEASFGVPSCE